MKMNLFTNQSRAMLPTLVLAWALWLNSLLLLFIYALAVWSGTTDPFSGIGLMILLALGFSISVAIWINRKYRRGTPFNDEA